MNETFAKLDINERKGFITRLRLAWAVLMNRPLEIGITEDEAKMIYEKYKEDFVFDGPKEVDPDWVKKQVLAMTAEENEPVVTPAETAEIQKAMEALEESGAPVNMPSSDKTKAARRKPRPNTTNRKPATSNKPSKPKAEGATEKQPRGPRTRNTKPTDN